MTDGMSGDGVPATEVESLLAELRTFSQGGGWVRGVEDRRARGWPDEKIAVDLRKALMMCRTLHRMGGLPEGERSATR